MSCADPETIVWRAGYYRPYSGFAIEMAFRCNGTFDIPTYKYQLLQKMAYAKLIQIVIVLSKGNIGL